ncbi:MAG: SDR family NAD(P)-dependent oxidoreductase [Propionicimonas sp.]|uniref:SDR family NAD(P)-dependent oxidoreductase n=1 Tax=Propionicimonas sp. TaxID=1955623 RepID=UPI003D0EB54E
MSGRTIVITGASDGVGAAAARELARRGENVVVVGRSPEKTAAVAEPLGAPYHVADYASLAEVRRLAAELDAAYPRIDVLANNAGGIMGARTVTGDGFELTFQVNHLAGFLLTSLLRDKLVASEASVIQTSSVAARAFGRIDLDDLQNERRYSPQAAYGAGKLANILFTRELHRRHHADGISTAAFHPGVVATNFAATTSTPMRLVYHSPLKRLFTIRPERGADQLVWLAEGTPGATWQSGLYYEKRRPARSAAQASDDDLARRFWDASEQLLAGA